MSDAQTEINVGHIKPGDPPPTKRGRYEYGTSKFRR
jgi:hypothetical protein